MTTKPLDFASIQEHVVSGNLQTGGKTAKADAWARLRKALGDRVVVIPSDETLREELFGKREPRSHRLDFGFWDWPHSR